jgi:GGDEF domain-containing protein
MTFRVKKRHRQLRRAFNRRSPISFNLLGQEVYTTLSIGIALGSDYTEQVSTCLRDAGTAMHQAKARGKARYEIFGR